MFLSDGAFEEQRGSDWAPRWWRAADSGLVAPLMIANGRRIDQRTTMSQQGGVAWFVEHLRLNGFDPLVIDGRDPAAFVWAIIEMERRLEAAGAAAERGEAKYPVPLPYTVAIAPKGAGFAGEGTNLAHNLPLRTYPSVDPEAARRFNESARRLFVPKAELDEATAAFLAPGATGRPRERDHALATRRVPAPVVPPPSFRAVVRGSTPTTASPMAAIDEGFLRIVLANPSLRPRVGNPDEMRSNRMVRTLEALGFRVTDPEPGVPERLTGAVITALNEEAVAAAALANQGGINVIVTYEAFGTKMYGVIRQSVIFAHHLAGTGRTPGWLSVPLVLTSHTWENAKNEQSHQDPSMAEAMLGEISSVSRVVFPADHNGAAATMEAVYRTHGQIWSIVVPKSDDVPDLFDETDARRLAAEGGMALPWAGHRPREATLALVAVGAFQLAQTLRASGRLAKRDVPHVVSYLFEPGRFRSPRSSDEAAHLAPAETRAAAFPPTATNRIVVTHTRPEPMLGVLAPHHTGARTAGLGYIGHGGTLDTAALLFVNRCSWAHIVDTAAGLLALDRQRLLDPEELAALDGRRNPRGVII